VSIALRSGVDYKYIVEQLKGIRCPSTIRQKGLKVLSCPDAIGRLIEKVAKLQNGQKIMATEAHITDEQRFQRPTANTYYKFEDASKRKKWILELQSWKMIQKKMIQKMQTLRFVLSAAEKLSTRAAVWCAETADIQNADNCLRF